MAAVEEAATAMGLVLLDGLQGGACEVWAEHVPALRLMGAMRTQWRHGFNGRTGLDYTALPIVERRLGMSRAEAAEAFDNLRTMEAAALDWYAEQG